VCRLELAHAASTGAPCRVFRGSPQRLVGTVSGHGRVGVPRGEPPDAHRAPHRANWASGLPRVAIAEPRTRHPWTDRSATKSACGAPTRPIGALVERRCATRAFIDATMNLIVRRARLEERHHAVQFVPLALHGAHRTSGK
jgi:hypothetical protein